MGETTDSIRRDINRERHELEDNLGGIEAKVKDATAQVQDKVEDVQQKVKDATDWRTQFDRRPMVGLAVAFGGGVLLASMMGGSNDQGRSSYGGYQPQYQGYGSQQQSHGGVDVGKQHASSTFDNVKGALMGVAAAQLKNVLADALPGFDDEYKQVEKEKNSASSSTSRSSSSTSQGHQSSVDGEQRRTVD